MVYSDDLSNSSDAKCLHLFSCNLEDYSMTQTILLFDDGKVTIEECVNNNINSSIDGYYELDMENNLLKLYNLGNTINNKFISFEIEEQLFKINVIFGGKLRFKRRYIFNESPFNSSEINFDVNKKNRIFYDLNNTSNKRY
jgi:hypothetical protein